MCRDDTTIETMSVTCVNSNPSMEMPRQKDSPAAAIRFDSDSPSTTAKLGESLGRVCRAGDVILLIGSLGAGKTCFVKGLARGMGIRSTVRSPSFVLLARYPGRVPLAHLDLYRIEGRAAIDDLGLEEQLDDSVIVVEWGDKIGDRWNNVLHIEFEETGEQSRRMQVSARGAVAAGRLREWAEASR